YGQLPLSFTAKHGQMDPRVKFISRGKGYALYLTGSEAVLALRDATFRMSFPDANNGATVSALEELPGKVNYFIGRDPKGWRTDVPTYARVRYQEVWPGIDLIFYGNQGSLEYDFVVSPGADPGQVRLRFDGADQLRLEDDRLIASTGAGEIVQLAPVIYQEIEGERREVAGAYKLDGREVAFELAAYDTEQPL
ncbi:MAG: hypothetical protein GY953_52560, partial [bacterium]|nr:hypothetical protein [bacterium]